MSALIRQPRRASPWLFFVTPWVVVAIGWVVNLIKLYEMLGGPVSAMFVARAVGTIAMPLGAALGYF